LDTGNLSFVLRGKLFIQQYLEGRSIERFSGSKQTPFVMVVKNQTILICATAVAAARNLLERIPSLGAYGGATYRAAARRTGV